MKNYRVNDAIIVVVACAIIGLFGLLFFAFIGVLEKDLYSNIPRAPRPEFGTKAPDCYHLYNTDRHAAWTSCMGVGFKIKAEINRSF